MATQGDIKMSSRIEEELQREVGFPKANIGTYVEYEETVDLDEDMKLDLTGEKGYRTVIAGHGVKHGDYYFEVEIL